MSYGFNIKNSAGVTIYDSSRLALLPVDVFYVAAGSNGSRSYNYTGLTFTVSIVGLGQSLTNYAASFGHIDINVSGQSVTYTWVNPWGSGLYVAQGGVYITIYVSQ